MLRHRLIAGTILAAAVAGVLVGDAGLFPACPFLLICVLLVGSLSTLELIALMPHHGKPRPVLCLAGVIAVLAGNWLPLAKASNLESANFLSDWGPVIGVLTMTILGSFIVELALFREPGDILARVSNTIFVVVYLGLLPSFFIKLRWLDMVDSSRSNWALAMTVFVPKCCDIGAYFSGRIYGRRKFSPYLSPKKTWEGFGGGMAAAVLTAVVGMLVSDLFRHGILEAITFGVLVGFAGVLGDLAESLIKRDCHAKDAGRHIPGFGGMLDVIDSLLFAAPVAYLLLTWQ